MKSSQVNFIFYSECSLLNEFGSEVVTACNDGTCITGSPNCRESSCGYVLNDQIYPAILLSNVTSQFTNIGLLTIGDCTPPVIIAIGAGGKVQAPLGGGSGFIEYKILEDTNTQTLTQLVAVVGGDWIMNPMDPDYKYKFLRYNLKVFFFQSSLLIQNEIPIIILEHLLFPMQPLIQF